MSGKDISVTILAVDDEPLNNDLMQRAFRGTNRKLVITESPVEGLELLVSEEPQVILVDYSMPQMSGVEFLQKARDIRPEAIGIMVTGYPELQEVVEAQGAGLVHHIVAKPWRVNDLVAIVERAISMRDLNVAVTRLKERHHKE